MAISTANSPKALAPGLAGYAGGGDYPLQDNVVRDAATAHNSLPGASRGAELIPSMGRSPKGREAYHNCGGAAYHNDGGCAHE